jgi:hypothetical protein
MDFPECCRVHHLDNFDDDDEEMTRSRRASQGTIDMSLFHGIGGGISTTNFLHDSGSVERGVLVHRGLRVRMGIDVGHCKRQLHPTTRTFRYKGSPIVYAKALVGAFPSGGVVAVTHRVQAELAGQMSLLKGSSLCHLGVHVISDKVRAKCSVFAIVPSDLEARLLRMKPLEVKFEIAPGYLSAPGVMPLAAVEDSSTQPLERPNEREPDASTKKPPIKRHTLSVHCHNNPNSRPLIIAFASLVLVEEMQTSAPNGVVGSRVGGGSSLSHVIQRFASGNGEMGADEQDGVGAQEGSVRRGVAYLTAMLGDSSIRSGMRSGASMSAAQRAPRASAPGGGSPPHLIIPSSAAGEGIDGASTLNLGPAGDDSVRSGPKDDSVRGGSRHSSRKGGVDDDMSIRSGKSYSHRFSVISNDPDAEGAATFRSLASPSTASRMSGLLSPATNPMMESLRTEAQRLAGPVIRMSLATTNGYECQEDEGNYMVAFDSALDATRWGAILCRIIDNMFAGRFSVAVGMHWAMPTSISPHVSSGRADYFGTIVNAAARVHSLASTRTCTYGRSTTIVTQATLDKLTETPSLFRDLSLDVGSNADSKSDEEPTNGGAAASGGGGDEAAAAAAKEKKIQTEIEEDLSASRGKSRNSRLSCATSTAPEFDNERSGGRANRPIDREAEGLPPIVPPDAPGSPGGEGNLQRGMLFNSLGKQRLKGFTKPIELFTATLPEELSFDLLRLEETIVELSKGKTGDMFDEENSDYDGSLHFWDGEKYAIKNNNSPGGGRDTPDRLTANSGLSDDDNI